MMKHLAVLSTLAVFASPALAFEIEEIGTLQAVFDGESIAQPTVIAKSGNQADPTAFLVIPGGGVSKLSLAGYSGDNKRLGIDATFMSEKPGLKTVPIDLSITYSPSGTSAHWTSEGAPTPPAVTFTTFELGPDGGRAEGAFNGTLCYAKDYGSGVDTENCRQIEGSFETDFFVE